jgi:septum formation protein
MVGSVEMKKYLSHQPIILASSSPARLKLLEMAGIEAIAKPASIDEEEVKSSCIREGFSALRIAETLADLKALRIARAVPDLYVLGADQTLDLEGQLMDKPQTRARAKSQLLAMAGKKHQLYSALVLYHGGAPIWNHAERCELRMRPLSEPFIERYLDVAGEEILSSVGGYHAEALGPHLFESVSGSHSGILGLPLLPLLGFLRQRGVIDG